MNKTMKMSALLVWVSFFAFIALYVLQKGCGMIGMEEPFFMGEYDKAQVYHTSLSVNIMALVVMCAGFMAIWHTKNNKKIELYGYKWESWITIFLICGMFIAKACWSKPLLSYSAYIHNPYVHFLIILLLSLLSVPVLLFFFSWIQEKSSSFSFDSCNRFIHGKKFLYICASISLIVLCVEVFFAFSLDMWNDEPASLGFASGTWIGVIGNAASDVHPPLYFLILKVFIYVLSPLNYIYAAKLASVLPYFILYLICLTWIRRSWGNYMGGLSALAIVCMPMMMYTGVEMRMYGWCLLFTTATWYSLYNIRHYNRRQDWFWMVFFSVLSVYTHLICGIAISWLWLFLGIWSYRQRLLRRWFLSALLVGLAYLPYFLIICFFVNETMLSSTWMPLVGLRDFFDIILSPTRDVLIAAVILVVMSEIFIEWKHSKSEESTHALLGMVLIILVVGCMVIISCIDKPCITPRIRYIIPMTGCLWLGVLLAVRQLNLPKLQAFIAIMMIFVAVSEAHSFIYVNIRGKEETTRLNEYIKGKNNVKFVAAKGTDCYKALVICWMMEKMPLYDITEERDTAEAYHLLPGFPSSMNGWIEAGNAICCIATQNVDIEPSRKSLEKYDLYLSEPKIFYIGSGHHEIRIYDVVPRL